MKEKIKVYISWLFALSVLFVTGCSNNPQITGTGSSSGNAKVAGVVYSPQGEPASNTEVNYIFPDYIPSVDNNSKRFCDTTDSDGRYSVIVDSLTGYNVHAVNLEDSSQSLERDLFFNKSVIDRDVVLSNPSKMSLVLPQDASPVPGYIYIPGTMIYKEVSGGPGIVTLESVPAASMPVAKFMDGGNETSVNIQKILLFDDFNDGDAYSELSGYIPLSEWDNWSDMGVGGSSDILPEGSLYDFTLNLTEDGSYDGLSFYATYMLGENADSLLNGVPFMFTTCFISAEGGPYSDLSDMTAISFYCKGSGKIRLEIPTVKIWNYSAKDSWAQFGKIIDCPPEWEKITVDVSELTPPQGSAPEADGITWSEVCDSVMKITFLLRDYVDDTTEIYIDDIYLHGISESDIAWQFSNR